MITAIARNSKNNYGALSTDRPCVTAGRPKTRSGKIMRRILRKIAEGETEQLGDTSTLLDPGITALLIQGMIQ